MSTWPDSFEAPTTKPGSPVWELARWLPGQGSWTEADYLELEGPAVEFDQGMLEVLPLPPQAHQLLAQHFFVLLHAFVHASSLGRVLMAPVPVRLWNEKFREPDVVFLKAERVSDSAFCEGADLVLEVVSEGAASRRRDLEVKPLEYARAGIAEYWILDPVEQAVIVRVLADSSYEARVYSPGEWAASTLLPGFRVEAAAWLNAAKS